MAKLASELVLSMVDRVSGPARRIDQNLENLRRQQQRTNETFNSHRNAMATTAVAAYAMATALSTPIQNAIAFENKLVDIQQKARLTVDELEKLGGAIRSGGLETGVGAQSYGEAVDGLMAGGLDVSTSVTAANPLAKTSLAYETSVEDMVAATTALLDNLGIAETGLMSAFDAMAVGGKEGKFELKDMAGQFPAITAQARSLGMQGEESLASLVAWLQVARLGTATGAEAATNMANFMQKVLAPDAVKKFGAEGIDIVGELKKAVELGIDPIEHAVGLINGITGGDRAKLGEMFADTQVLNFLLQATTQLEEYKRIREAAMNSTGTVEQDYAIRMDSSGGVLARFDASIQELNLAIGGALTPKLMEFVESITPMVDGVSKFVSANEELVSAVVQVTAALIGLKLLSHAGGMLNALLGMNFDGNRNNMPGMPGAPPSKTPTSGGPNPLSQYLWLSPIIADQIGTAVWDGIHGEGATAANKAIADGAWDRTAERLTNMWNSNRYEDVVTSDDPGERAMLEQMAALRADIAKLEGANLPVPPVEISFMKAELQVLEDEAAAAGFNVGASLQAGIAGQSGAVATEMATIMSRLRIMAAAGVNIPMRVNGPQVSPVVTRASIAGARASGGPVKGGSTYEINERGTEYFTPNVDGFVHKAGSFQPPGMPSFGGKSGGGSREGGVSVRIGEINLQNPTNANPHQIARALGDIVGNRLRASHSNGAM